MVTGAGGGFTRVTGVTRGDGTKGGECGKGKGGGEKILAHGTDRTNHQLKVVQEFLADLKRALKA